MRKYNISKPKKYISNGAEKTYWANIGTMTEFDKPDGSVSRILEIPAISLEANIFPMEPKVAVPKVYENGEVPASQVPPADIDPADIPF